MIKSHKGQFTSYLLNYKLVRIFMLIASTPLLLALNSVFVTFIGFTIYNLTPIPILLFASFLVTLGIYGLNKATDVKEDAINRPESAPVIPTYYTIMSVVSMICGFFVGVLSGVSVFLILLMPMAIGIIYSVKISESIPRLKEIVGVKSLAVAISWALTGALLPDSIYQTNFFLVIIFFFFVLTRVFSGTIFCDVMDMKGDILLRVKTIPLVLGESKTKKLLFLVNTSGLFLFAYCLGTGVLLKFLPALLFGVLYGYLIMWLYFKCNKRFTCRILLDTEWFPALLLVSLFKL